MPDLKQFCVHCGNKISFDSKGVGLLVNCPHCGNKTTLQNPLRNTKNIAIGFMVAVLVLGFLVYGAIVHSKHKSAKLEAEKLKLEILSVCNGLTVTAMKDQLAVVSARSEVERIFLARESSLSSDQKHWMKAIGIREPCFAGTAESDSFKLEGHASRKIITQRNLPPAFSRGFFIATNQEFKMKITTQDKQLIINGTSPEIVKVTMAIIAT